VVVGAAAGGGTTAAAANTPPANTPPANTPPATGNSTNSALPVLPPTSGANGTTLSWDDCVAYGKKCRDVICAFQNYTATCKNGGSCTCFDKLASGSESSMENLRELMVLGVVSIASLALVGVSFGF
ncbi:4271_t:CDS:2, partial [Paraglomus brasilianum]